MDTARSQALLLGLVLLAPCFRVLLCRDSRLPLRPDWVQLPWNKTGILGCNFDGEFKELDQVWNPDLGPPFGKMNCIACKCLAVTKKRRVVGKVSCKNFASLCPKPTCSNATTTEGSCCKTCPEDGPLTIRVFGGETDDDGDYNWGPGYQEFMAVLSGRFHSVLTEGAGRAYLTVYKRSLHYSVYFARLDEAPTAFHVLDLDGNIVYEDKLSLQRRVGSKICGVWEDIPRTYSRALRRGELRVSLVTPKKPEGAIGGAIFRLRQLAKEVFSSVLFPTLPHGVDRLGYAGAAVIDIRPGRSALQVSVIFNASRISNSSEDNILMLHIEKNDGRRKHLRAYPARLEEREGLFLVQTLMKLEGPEERWLSRGRLMLSLSSDFLHPSEFLGIVTPLYQAVLSSVTAPGENLLPAAGVAIVQVADDNSFHYRVKVEGAQDAQLGGLKIEGELSRNRKQLVAKSDESEQSFLHGESRGQFNRETSARDVELLYQEKLSIEVQLADQRSVLRGQLQRVLHSLSVRSERDFPIILRPYATVPEATTSENSPSAPAGVIWLADPQLTPCELHYTVALAGLPASRPTQFNLSLCPDTTTAASNGTNCVHRFNNYQVVNKGFMDAVVYGVGDGMSEATWQQLNDSALQLHVSVSQQPAFELVAKLPASNHCWASQYQRDRYVYEDQGREEGDAVRRDQCDYDGVEYKSGDTWIPKHATCSMCNCYKGHYHCDTMPCPSLDCERPLNRSDDCCPSCAADDSAGAASCMFGGHAFAHASAWHPYLVPGGFDKCITCSCQNAVVSCKRPVCPRLACEIKDQYKENEDDCCKKCKESSTTTLSPTTPGPLLDEAVGRCAFRGEIYDNGAEWSPVLAHVGKVCVQCTCRMGVVKCSRPDCTASCAGSAVVKACCPHCTTQKQLQPKRTKLPH